jgi:hypothetical protein
MIEIANARITALCRKPTARRGGEVMTFKVTADAETYLRMIAVNGSGEVAMTIEAAQKSLPGVGEDDGAEAGEGGEGNGAGEPAASGDGTDEPPKRRTRKYRDDQVPGVEK